MLHLLVAVGAMVTLTAAYSWLGVTNPTTVALSFLLVVLVVATAFERWVAISASFLAFLCFNFFFLPPLGTLVIADPAHWVALSALLIVSVVASHLSALARRRAEDATARRDELARLFDLTRDILLTTDTTDAMSVVAGFVLRRFKLDAVTIWVPDGDVWASHQAGAHSIDVDVLVLDQAFAAARIEGDVPLDRTDAGQIRLDLARGEVWLTALRRGHRPIGLLALRGGSLEPGTRDAIAGITAIAIDRAHLLEEREKAELIRRGADLKAALLGSLSHDLKTPLTAVTVAANNLNANWLDAEGKREQADIVLTELARLNRLFEDIVDMASIETHAIDAELEWVQPGELVEAASRQAHHAIASHSVEVEIPGDPVFVRVDPRLMSSALAHLLENAGQYSPPGSVISVKAQVIADRLQIQVRDRGIGISAGDVEHVFERFYRGAEARRQRFGTGMGLAITRGLLAAQSGRAWAENHSDGGAVFTIAAPAATRSATAEEEMA